MDRGFRDVVPFLQQSGFNVIMPAMKGQRLQLTTKESNDSRFVTKIRWVVEAVHGVIGQKYKLLHNQFMNNTLDNARTYCRIACFLHNRFGKVSLVIAASVLIGNRTVGCCSHVAAIIYHLSHGRYLSRIYRPDESF